MMEELSSGHQRTEEGVEDLRLNLEQLKQRIPSQTTYQAQVVKVIADNKVHGDHGVAHNKSQGIV
jgi:hypothetical protein